jgi:Protein of unknown function (DUF2961)
MEEAMGTVDGGAGGGMAGLDRLTNARSRSISAENLTGAPGAGGLAVEGFGAEAARGLGPGWKISPAVVVPAGATFTLAEIDGPGCVQQIWMAVTGDPRLLALRFYWDGQEQPSVQCPVGDFFVSGWPPYAQVSSLAVCVNPVRGFNCYWRMPFRRRCRITVENLTGTECTVFYQINYELTEVAAESAYFHAQFRRVPRLDYGSVYPLVDGLAGRGHYVGTYVAWGANGRGWWGEGELKFHLDGEAAPTICGTGTEDYFGGAWCFRDDGRYQTFSGPYTGMPLAVEREDGQGWYSLYRWHILDPIRFSSGLRVTMQALGIEAGRYAPLRDDIASVAYWYQTLPTSPFPRLPGPADLAVAIP